MNIPIKSGATPEGQWRHLNGLDGGHKFRAAQNDGLHLAPLASANGRMRRMFGQEPMFPFRLYQIPSWYRTTPSPTTDWLKFCIRGGLVFINWTAVTPTLTDGETSPDSETFPVSAGAGVNEVSATAGVAQFWFWLALTSTTAVVTSGASPPTWSSAAIPIGWVDTTDTPNKFAHVRQLVRTDLFTCL